MPGRKVSCPGCQTTLSIGQALPASLRCPKCRMRFQAAKDGKTRLTATHGINMNALAVIAGGAMLFAALGACLLVYCLQASSAKPEPEITSEDRPKATAPKAPVFPPTPLAVIKKPPLANESAVGTVAESGPDAGVRPGVAKGVYTEEAFQATNQKEINSAIDKGVAYLKRTVNDTGFMASGVGGQNSRLLGTSALAGLSLLSCGVPADDPKLIGISRRILEEAPALGRTYEVACCIWFLDKLGQQGDQEVIRQLACRLIAGQLPGGGWDYTVPILPPSQQEELLRLLEDKDYLKYPVIIQQNMPAPKQLAPAKKQNTLRKAAKITGDLTQLPALRYRPGQVVRPGNVHEDNSITQFAVLALWAAQKHGVPVAQSLAMAEARFRQYQNADGTWNYELPPRINLVRRDSMTCAGLLTLAVGRVYDQSSTASTPRDLAQDPQIAKSLMFLGTRIGLQDLRFEKPDPDLKGTAKNQPSGVKKIQTQLKKAVTNAAALNNRGSAIHADSWGDYYFLWSLERVGVVFNLRTIGGKDWYDWGSKIIVAHQHPEGSWNDTFAGPVDTCFALLFLKRVNVAVDLTAILQTLGGARDPGARQDPQQAGPDSFVGIKPVPALLPGLSKPRTALAPAPAKSF